MVMYLGFLTMASALYIFHSCWDIQVILGSELRAELRLNYNTSLRIFTLRCTILGGRRPITDIQWWRNGTAMKWFSFDGKDSPIHAKPITLSGHNGTTTYNSTGRYQELRIVANYDKVHGCYRCELFSSTPKESLDTASAKACFKSQDLDIHVPIQPRQGQNISRSIHLSSSRPDVVLHGTSLRNCFSGDDVYSLRIYLPIIVALIIVVLVLVIVLIKRQKCSMKEITSTSPNDTVDGGKTDVQGSNSGQANTKSGNYHGITESECLDAEKGNLAECDDDDDDDDGYTTYNEAEGKLLVTYLRNGNNI